MKARLLVLLLSAVSLLLCGCAGKRNAPLMPEGHGRVSYVVGFDQPVPLDQAIAVYRERLTRAGLRHFQVRAAPPDRVVIEIDRAPQLELLRELIASEGRLGMHLVDDRSGLLVDAYDDAAHSEIMHIELKEQGERGGTLVSDDPSALRTFLKQRVDLTADGRPRLIAFAVYPDASALKTEAYLLYPAELTNADLAEARLKSVEWSPEPSIELRLTPEAAGRFDALTAGHLQERLAILIDDRVMTAPVIQDRISTGQVTLTPAASGAARDDARLWAVLLNLKPLPGRPTILQTVPR